LSYLWLEVVKAVHNISDKPSAPENLRISGFTENSVSLKWEQPSDDGGCLVTGYLVEHREGMKRAWTRDGTCTEEEYTAIALTEGEKYVFRVAAENEVGVGDFVELSKAIVPKSEHGKSLLRY
jgi:titin